MSVAKLSLVSYGFETVFSIASVAQLNRQFPSDVTTSISITKAVSFGHPLLSGSKDLLSKAIKSSLTSNLGVLAKSTVTIRLSLLRKPRASNDLLSSS